MSSHPAPPATPERIGVHPRRLAALLLGLAAALLITAAPPAALAEQAAGAAAADIPGPVENLYRQRQYEQALKLADELRARAKPDQPVDGDSEYWAARALRTLRRPEESRERFLALAKLVPGTELAATAEVDAAVSALGVLEGGARDEAGRKLASDVATELEAIAGRHADRPDSQARALYIAGNSLRMAQADERARGVYERCRKLEAAAATGYPAKCTLGLGSVAARNYEVAEARGFYQQCALQQNDDRTAERCQKAVSRLEVVGAPAAELKVETWLHGKPVTIQQLRGKVVLLFFFATWCPHCKDTLPTLPRYLEQYAGQPFELIAITNNVRGQTTESAKLFVADPQWQIRYPTAVDEAGQTSIAMEASGIPQMVLIDKKGVVRWSDHPAYLKDAMIERLLAE